MRSKHEQLQHFKPTCPKLQAEACRDLMQMRSDTHYRHKNMDLNPAGDRPTRAYEKHLKSITRALVRGRVNALDAAIDKDEWRNVPLVKRLSDIVDSVQTPADEMPNNHVREAWRVYYSIVCATTLRKIGSRSVCSFYHFRDLELHAKQTDDEKISVLIRTIVACSSQHVSRHEATGNISIQSQDTIIDGTSRDDPVPALHTHV